MWLLLASAWANEPAEDDVPTQHFREIVFAEAPEKAQRDKLVRKALRTSRSLNGGKDWGRTMCFVFNGPVEPGALETALRKARLDGEIREARGCDEPPPEAFIPPAPAAVRRVTLFEGFEPVIVRKAFTYLLDGDYGVGGLYIAHEKSDRLCLELEREVPDDELTSLLSTAPIRVVDIARTADCAEALATP